MLQVALGLLVHKKCLTEHLYENGVTTSDLKYQLQHQQIRTRART